MNTFRVFWTLQWYIIYLYSFRSFCFPRFPKIGVGLFNSVSKVAAIFFSKSEYTYGFYDIMIVKRHRNHFFYYSYQEFWIQYYTFADEKNISQKNYRYVFYLFIFTSTTSISKV